ncbi:uncharacterized protein LOC131157743 [Malania oleifera]|uniref:uncharacterized protein LOC131157743 n=1 Tax=Malania oleifera TaxID=397392 RepID=UPI0025AE5335|nr:uncharacterized protein LOC131157743 [Malania oleifera]
MQGFDVILGMNWLAANYASIDCHKKEVVFKSPGEQEYRFVGTCVRTPPQILSTVQVRRLLLEGCQGYLACVKESLEGESRLEYISIVKDFPNVFLEDLSGLPLDRKVEFAIELSIETTPISKAPYRMVPMELKELKEQIQELLDKGFHQAGVILGPSVIARNSTYTNNIFPPGGTVALETFANFGFMIHAFVLGVQFDATMLRSIGRRAAAIGLCGNVLPLALGFMALKGVQLDEAQFFGFEMMVIRNSVTYFVVTASVLTDLDILNSEVGCLATFVACISDASSWIVVELLPKIVTAIMTSSATPFLPSLLLVGYYGLVYFALRPLVMWIVRSTPEGKPMKGSHFLAILMLLLMVGNSGDVIGQHCALTAFAFGLFLPSTPPLTSTLVEKLNIIASGVLLPVFCASTGARVDVFSALGGGKWVFTEIAILMAYVGKFIGTIVPSLYFEVPFKDALSLALIMCCKGIVEIAFYSAFLDNELVNQETYALLVISMVIITWICRPIVRYLYDPSVKYVVQKGLNRIIYRATTDLRLLVCIHSEENVSPIIQFLETSNPTRISPISIFTLQLTDLEGRAAAVLAPVHHKSKPTSQLTRPERIANAFNNFEQSNHGSITLQHFIAVAPYASMHDDICTLALDKRTSIVIVPFHKRWAIDGDVEATFPSIRIVNKNVIGKAPCSVGILIDRSQIVGKRPALAAPSLYRIAMIFLGGADDWEALEYSRRMAGHPGVSLTVVWIKSCFFYEMTDTIDSKLMYDSRATATGREKIVYREEIVTNGVGTTQVIRSMESAYDLFIVGRRHDTESPATQGLTEWGDCPELGLIGDMLTASEFHFSVLKINENGGFRKPYYEGGRKGESFHQAGVIVGPLVVARNSTYTNNMFPPGGTVALETFANFGFMIHAFVLGVQFDATMLRSIGRRAVAIGLCGNVLPLALGFLALKGIKVDEALFLGFEMMVIRNSVTYFVVTASVLIDLDILNSEVGCLATFVACISDASSWIVVELLPKIVTAIMTSSATPFLPSLLLVGYYGLVYFALRPLVMWIVRSTPEGKPMKGSHFLAILTLLLMVGYSGDVIGQHCAFTAFAFGLFLPSTPPLTSTLVEKLNIIASGVLLPVFCASTGARVDVFSALGGGKWVFTEIAILMGYVGKFIGTIVPSLYFEVPFKDALSLALIMCCKGIVEIAFYSAFLDNEFIVKLNTDHRLTKEVLGAKILGKYFFDYLQLVNQETYALLVISMVIITWICRPIVHYLYDPSAKYMVQKGLNRPPYRATTDLRLLVCIHSEENVSPIIHILETSNPTRTSPISILTLQLTDLDGRAAAVVLPVHHKNKPTSQLTRPERIANAFNNFEKSSHGCITLQHFIAVAPYASMHDDICTLALDKRTNIVIVPFHKRWAIDGTVEATFPSIRIVNKNVIGKAPCSVGILIDRSQIEGKRPALAGPSLYRIAMIFLGGADDQDALEYSRRMAGHPGVSLTVVWIKSCFFDEMTDTIDSKLMYDLRANATGREKIVYKEEIVTDGVGTTQVIRSMESAYDLFIVGRRHDTESPATQGLTEWGDCPELGLIGDMLTASEFQFSVLVLVLVCFFAAMW